MYQPSELGKYLRQLGIAPKKRLSQHFLCDQNIIKKIVAFADLKPQDVVVEVGPGAGALTEALLETGAEILAIEKDPPLAEALQRLSQKYEQCRIYCADILSFPLDETVMQKVKPPQRAKVVANLPYHLTSPIIALFAPKHRLFSSLVVMVQEEVARRYIAEPGTKEYGSFSVFLRYYSSPHYGFRVSRHCFFPQPRVDSAVIKCELRPPPYVSHEGNFFRMVRTGFGQRRKMLRSSLKDLYQPEWVEKGLQSIGKPPHSRPEELSLQQFISLFEILAEKNS
ncbi:MAG: 16S rRNA (adenine(1518)-N(6)/adenine(1519)-N(6))-dimethyltransferase RsmA [Waddliaceae bacterium]